MARQRTEMRQIREVLRLRAAGMSQREIATAARVGKTTVQETLIRADACALKWPLEEGMTDKELTEKLFPSFAGLSKGKALPDWSLVHQELKQKGVTLSLLWLEYREDSKEGLQYSWFCHLYREWLKKTNVVMRHDHKAGEKTFVDFAGLTVSIVNRETGEVEEAQIFIAALGASSYTFALAVPDQKIASWIHAHVEAFKFFHGVSEILVPDNLKSGVTTPCRYEPVVHNTYYDMARHYGTAVIPARVRKPRDKAKAEVAVQVAERWILAKLRKQTFFSVEELNKAIRPLLEEINNKTMRHLGASRKELFEKLEKPVLKSLPANAYELTSYKKAKVNIDYHVEFDRHYYSVPYKLVGAQVEMSVTRSGVEILLEGKRVAAHKRSYVVYKYSTLEEHKPAAHKACSEWTPQRLISWAKQTGPETAKCFEYILKNLPHPEQGYRSCLGILRLGKIYSADRLEAACKRALHMHTVKYKSIKSILKSNLDKEPLTDMQLPLHSAAHENIRGSEYYQ